jgi:uncharacterized delta-60 repeat protein
MNPRFRRLGKPTSGGGPCQWLAIAAVVATAIALGAATARAGGENRGTGFGDGGVVRTDFGGLDSAEAVAMQTDGKIVVAGVGARNFALARYTTDGRLDETFGARGKVVTDFGGDDRASAVALQADGKIVVAGASRAPGTAPWSRDFAVARYTAAGRLDEHFGGGGKVVTDFGGDDRASSVAIQQDGKIVVAGSARGPGVARYTSAGSLDPSFGTRGRTALGTISGFCDYAAAIAILSDGRIVIAGSSGRSHLEGCLWRLTSGGQFDRSFGRGGEVYTGTPFSAVAIQGDGRIVAAGYRDRWRNGGRYVDLDFGLERYTAAGRPDRTFGRRGVAVTRFGRRSWAQASALVVHADSKIVAAGSQFGDFALARYTARGRRDTTFSRDGTVVTNLGGTERATALAAQPDGKLVVAGTSRGNFALVRYEINGLLDR